MTQEEKEKSTGLLFTSVTCPNCPVAKQYFEEIKEERDDIDIHLLSVNEPKGSRLAKKFNIQSVPTFVFYGPGHEEPKGLVGAQPKHILNKYIDIAVGKKKYEERKPFSLKRLFGIE